MLHCYILFTGLGVSGGLIMFRIAYQSVGSDMVTKDETTSFTNKSYAVLYAFLRCGRMIGRSNLQVMELGDEQYQVLSEDVPVGNFSITEL